MKPHTLFQTDLKTVAEPFVFRLAAGDTLRELAYAVTSWIKYRLPEFASHIEIEPVFNETEHELYFSGKNALSHGLVLGQLDYGDIPGRIRALEEISRNSSRLTPTFKEPLVIRPDLQEVAVQTLKQCFTYMCCIEAETGRANHKLQEEVLDLIHSSDPDWEVSEQDVLDVT